MKYRYTIKIKDTPLLLSGSSQDLDVMLREIMRTLHRYSSTLIITIDKETTAKD